MSITRFQSAFVGFTGLITLTCLYLNHFDNAFHFDDSHTIETNLYIRDLSNIPLFFTDARTYSSLPQNQAYRPMNPLSFAIDYSLAGNSLDPFFFHLSNFGFFILLLVGLFFFFKRIFELTLPGISFRWIPWIPAFIFGFHTAHAETINYICARSDSMSTFWIITAFLLYQYSPIAKKHFLYLIPYAIALGFKQSAIVFFPLLVLYHLCIEKRYTLADWGKHPLQKAKYMVYLLPVFLFSVGFYFLQDRLTPGTFIPGGKIGPYLITQPYILLLYIGQFLLPLHLTADTDLTVLKEVMDGRFFIGIIGNFLLVGIAIKAATARKWLPVTLGIGWFYLSHLPTSLVPLAEVMNDHRMFLPDIGLTLACTWAVYVGYKRYSEKPSSVGWRRMVTAFLILYFVGHSYGVYQRNEVWDSEKSLWYDVTIKSPRNGRGLMNYGLQLMAAGDFKGAEQYFVRAYELLPYYSYLHINMAILYDATQRKELAKQFYLSGLEYGESLPEPHYYYAVNRKKNLDWEEAIYHLEKALSLSPAHLNSRILLLQVLHEKGDFEKLREVAASSAEILPSEPVFKKYLDIASGKISFFEALEKVAIISNNADSLLNFSVKLYAYGRFEECIEFAERALAMKPEYAEAYNTICAAYNKLGKFDKAIQACSEALRVKKDFEIAKNNLQVAVSATTRINASLDDIKRKPEAGKLIALSLLYFELELPEQCIEACKQALLLDPFNKVAYNNMCSAYNTMRKWNEGIEACKKALEIDPQFTLAKNNLFYAQSRALH